MYISTCWLQVQVSPSNDFIDQICEPSLLHTPLCSPATCSLPFGAQHWGKVKKHIIIYYIYIQKNSGLCVWNRPLTYRDGLQCRAAVLRLFLVSPWLSKNKDRGRLFLTVLTMQLFSQYDTVLPLETEHWGAQIISQALNSSNPQGMKREECRGDPKAFRKENS